MHRAGGGEGTPRRRGACVRLTRRLPPQPASGQDCSGQCQCAAGKAPRCPAGVSLVLDGCGCCRVCAKQLGELCTERDPCDPHKGLFCDFGSPANRKIGVCTGKTCSPGPHPVSPRPLAPRRHRRSARAGAPDDAPPPRVTLTLTFPPDNKAARIESLLLAVSSPAPEPCSQPATPTRASL